MLAAPPPTQYDLHFSLFGFPVRVHPMFWVVTLVMGSNSHDAASVLTWVAAVFLSILVHELGHALAMRAYGLRPWIVLHGFGGLTGYDASVVQNSRGPDTLGQILISAAGPVAGFLLVGAMLLAAALAGHGRDIFFEDPWGIVPVVMLPNFRMVSLFYCISYICVFWGLVNLLPIYPLDGGQIAREALLKLNPQRGIPQSLWLSIFAAAAMAAFGLSHHSFITAMFFGYFAYASYATLEAYRGRGPW